MYTIKEIFDQAISDKDSIVYYADNHVSAHNYGVKVMMDYKTKRIEILDTTRESFYYSTVTDAQAEVFQSSGWNVGAESVKLDSMIRRIDKIEKLIKAEVNGSNNPRRINLLIRSKEELVLEHRRITELNN